MCVELLLSDMLNEEYKIAIRDNCFTFCDKFNRKLVVTYLKTLLYLKRSLIFARENCHA